MKEIALEEIIPFHPIALRKAKLFLAFLGAVGLKVDSLSCQGKQTKSHKSCLSFTAENV